MVTLIAALALVGCGNTSNASSSGAESSSAAASAAATESGSEAESGAGADSTGAAAGELSIFAANSLQKALPEVQALYTAQNPEVTFADTQFEASGTLVTKLAEGAGADVLITASKKTMDNAVANGSVDETTRIDMFKNDLVVCVQEDSDVAVTSLEDLATDDAIESIAIGDPNVVPAGKYALQAFESAGLVTYDEDDAGAVSNVVWDESIAGKINDGADKVGTVASYVKEGTCTVGLVYTSDIYRYDGIEVACTTPADSHKAILYPGAVVADSANAEAAADFIDFCLTDPEAQKVFSEYGFELV